MPRSVRRRVVLAGLAVTIGAATLGGIESSPARAETSFGVNAAARAQTLAAELAAYTDAARTCDLDAARVAYEQADSVLNAVGRDLLIASESRFLYFDSVFMGNQVPASLGLAGEFSQDYTCAERVDLAEDQAATWDEAVAFLTNSPASSPLVDDLAILRTVNQGIRLAQMALAGDPEANPQTPSTAPDPAGAGGHWLEFLADYPVARALITFRYPALAAEIDRLATTASAAFGGDPALGFPGAAEALAALEARYELALRLVTAAAKNEVPARPTFEPAAWETLDTLEDIVLTFFEIRDLITAGTPQAAAQVLVEYTDWLEYPISQKLGTSATTRAEVDLATAVQNYATTPDGATARALRDELAVAEQTFVGQYWGTTELLTYYEENSAPPPF